MLENNIVDHISTTNTGIIRNLFWCNANFNTILSHFENVSHFFHFVTDVREELGAASPEPRSEDHHS